MKHIFAHAWIVAVALLPLQIEGDQPEPEVVQCCGKPNDATPKLAVGDGKLSLVNADVEQQPAKKKYPRGHKPPSKEVKQQRHRVSHQRHEAKLKALPVITAQKWNTVTLGYGPAINDQGQCGDCYLNSGANGCASAQMISGISPKGSGFQLSIQCLLDCSPSLGGCGGGDEYQVAQLIQSQGLPSMSDYPGQGQSPGACKSVAGMKLYTISSIVMCSQTDGVATTQDIKNCVAAYGYVSVAVAANEDWDNYVAGTVMNGPPNPNGINHAIGIVGWDDTTTPPSWIAQNSWGKDWGNQGYANVAYGAYSIGTEAFACIATNPNPVPPAPPAPAPPAPGPAPAPGTATSFTISAALPAGNYEVAAAGNLAAWQTVQAAVNAAPALQPAGPVTPPSPATVEARLDALERRAAVADDVQARTLKAVLDLQALIGGKR